MLAEFRVDGFKNFGKELIFKLDDIKNYEFSTDAVINNFVKTGAIYGFNASGKTNLAHAIFDITLHLVDKEKGLEFFENYKNFNRTNAVKFYYRFRFGDDEVEYEYEKCDSQALMAEKVIINGNEVVSYRFNKKKKKPTVSLEGAENLNFEFDDNDKTFYDISIVKYICSNTILSRNRTNAALEKMVDFVDRMLLFSSLESNHYMGFRNGNETISKAIIEAKKVKEFEQFLKKNGIEYELVGHDFENENKLYCKYGEKLIDFFTIASRGTVTLALFYLWLIRLNSVSLVVIDEFDAFYHSALARAAVTELLKHKELQAIVTTHNTDILTNDLLRPDCYFLLQDGKIDSFANLTYKELRKAHNLQKMYKAGVFNAQ